MEIRKLFTLLLLSLMAVGAWAQTSARLVVWQKDGTKTYFDLTEEPKTTFSGTLLVITTSSVETQYQLSNILRYTYEGGTTDISQTHTHDMQFTQTNEGVTLRNVPSGTIVQLYDTAGKLLGSKTSDGHSTIDLSLSARPAGVYLVKVDDQTFKVMKR